MKLDNGVRCGDFYMLQRLFRKAVQDPKFK